jgi:4-amino-4-deoxy-L-arabinose transferase-like glycosyltransferase
MTRRGAMLLAAITALAAAVRFWGIGFGLPHTYARPDEDAIVTIATRIYRDGPNPHFFVYPTLYLYLMAFAYEVYYAALSMTGPAITMSAFMDRAATDPTPFYLISRIGAAILGTATVPVLFQAARRLFDVRTATIAAALLAAAFLHVRDSHFGVTDIPATFVATLAFWAIVAHDVDRTRWMNVLGAGVLCGLAGSTKYNAILVALPLFVRILQQSRPEAHRARWAIALCLLAGCGIAAGFLAGTPFSVVDSRLFLSELRGVQVHFLGGHGADLGYGWTYHLTGSLRYGLGAPMLAAALIGGAWLAMTRPATALVVLSFPVAYYLVIGAGRTVFIRYVDPILPFACLLAAVTVVRIATRAARTDDRIATALVMLLTGVLVWPSASRVVAFDRLIAHRDNRLVAAEWLESTVPPGSNLCQTGSPYGWLQSLPPGRFPACDFDPSSGMLSLPGSTKPAQLVVIQYSPLAAYPGFPEGAMPALRTGYRSIKLFTVEQPAHDPPPVYDEQDAFFAPLDGFGHLSRPGPAFEVFQHR